MEFGEEGIAYLLGKRHLFPVRHHNYQPIQALSHTRYRAVRI